MVMSAVPRQITFGVDFVFFAGYKVSWIWTAVLTAIVLRSYLIFCVFEINTLRQFPLDICSPCERNALHTCVNDIVKI